MVKSHLTRLGKDLAHATGVSSFTARLGSDMRIIMLHGVGDHLLSVSDFEKNLAFLKQEFEIVSLKEMIDRAESGAGIAGREIALTFDDGLRNNVTVAYPVLREMEIPATFFICPELIDQGRWLWNHEVRARTDLLEGEDQVDFMEKMEIDQSAGYVNETEAIVETMKTLSLSKRLELEAVLREFTSSFVPLPEHRVAYDLASWDEIRELDPELITIGSHTLTHPILPTLEDSDLEREIKDSKRRLESDLDREVEFFCYPNGCYDERASKLVAQTYSAAVTTESATVVSGLEMHRLPRIGIQPDPSTMAWRLFRP